MRQLWLYYNGMPIKRPLVVKQSVSQAFPRKHAILAKCGMFSAKQKGGNLVTLRMSFQVPYF